MGLLDDAIREHLELKRLRGADPGVVAQEEQDALGVVHPGDSPADRHTAIAAGLEAHDQEAHHAADPRLPATETAHSGSVGQETVEINMEAELAAESDFDLPSAPDSDTGPVAHPASARPVSDESLEWEAPEEINELTGDALLDNEQGSNAGRDANQDDSVEDVLEETPDFLRDTPEQERLWFEQRPPRDFDFNE
jgi:hypothetical protein